MTSMTLYSQSETFFDEFVAAFRSFDGRVIARRYDVPYLAMHSDGAIDLFVDHEAIEQHFQRIVDDYRHKGCRACRYKDMTVTPLGTRCFVASVTWQLLSANADVLSEWRESYNVKGVDDNARIFVSVDH